MAHITSLLKTVSVSVSLYTVFLLLTQLCEGAASSTEKPATTSQPSSVSDCLPIILGCCFGGLAVGLIVAVAVFYNRKHTINDLKMKIKQFQDEINRNNETRVLTRRLIDQKRELENQRDQLKVQLENQRDQLKVQLEEVEKQKQMNKLKLQKVEKEITEREIMFDKPEELLREKEDLLKDQWKLDQMKKDKDKQLLNIEKLLELFEIHITDNTDVEIWID